MGLFDKLKKAASVEERVTKISADAGAGVASAVVSGSVVAQADLSDPVFSGGMMGKGCGIKPSTGVVYAPVSGEVTAAFPTGHAFALLADDGAEILIHVGVDTVNMKGKGFTIIAKQGERVEAGAPLGTFSPAEIKAAGLDDTVMVLITNADDYTEVDVVASGSVKAGERLLEYSK